ncbi:putative leucine-rich repeat domain, L domain-containing protein [Rosa chinensis]|uniref:Putative leucine-rich repeat domain, L domain-containing protein n=1 Tax=Rosa chinensis TaxID=74649 RepID=A0A2P6SQK7_ROSCH|nr:putative leucine-rich repeat domain, L domain-containing protein [Rosa chinensis]
MTFPLVAPLYLQRLYLEGQLERVPRWISELTSLTKIGLKWSKLKARDDPLQALQALPNLMELNLIDYYTGEELTFKAQTFKKLMVLIIEQFDELKVVKIEDGAMPQLKRLTMCKCQNLKSLPEGVAGLNALKKSDGMRCPMNSLQWFKNVVSAYSSHPFLEIFRNRNIFHCRNTR